MYAETLVDGVFKKRRPVHRLPNGCPSSYSSKKKKKKASQHQEVKDQEINVDCMEIEQALQEIGKPIEAVLDDSGTVVTLIPCMESPVMDATLGTLSPQSRSCNMDGGCIIQSMVPSHHVMHETPPSSAESYPTVIDVSRKH